MRSPLRRAVAAVLSIFALTLVVAPAALAHERREVGPYTFVVGFVGEPVFTGQKSGLEMSVTRGETPVEGLEASLTAEAIYQDHRLPLELSPRFGEPGWYQSIFFPTAAGPYTFHITGTVEGTTIDESFTSSPEGFNEVQEATAGQFPIQFPTTTELVTEADAGAQAASLLPIALGLGALGAVLGLVALGVALAGRRRAG